MNSFGRGLVKNLDRSLDLVLSRSSIEEGTRVGSLGSRDVFLLFPSPKVLENL